MSSHKKIYASTKTPSCAFIFSAHVLLFSPPTCASQCKLRRLRANARLSALLYSRSCVRVTVTEWSRLALADSEYVNIVANYAAISKYNDSCKVYRDTNRVKSIVILQRCIDESCRHYHHPSVCKQCRKLLTLLSNCNWVSILLGPPVVDS